MKYQVLFSLKNNEKVFINVVCCSLDWRFKGKSNNNTQIFEHLQYGLLQTSTLHPDHKVASFANQYNAYNCYD